MLPNLDTLIEWLLHEIVRSGSEGVSFSQLLTLIDAFYVGPAKQGEEVLGFQTKSAVEVPPTRDRIFKNEVWKSLKSHPDVLVGENGFGNSLELREVEENPSEAPKIFVKSHWETTHAQWPALPQMPLATMRNETESEKSIVGVTEKGLEEQGYERSIDDGVEGENRTTYAESPVVRTQAEAPESEPITVDTAPLAGPPHSVQVAGSNGLSGTKAPEQGSQITEQLPIQTIPRRRGRPLKANKLDLAPGPNIPATLTRFQDSTVREDTRESLGDVAGAAGGHQGDQTTLAVPPRRRGRPIKAKEISPSLVPSTSTPTNELPRPEIELYETLPGPKKRPGRPKAKQTAFTSYDQFQRDAGIAGIYFDLPELNQARAGRPRKRMVALIKSEKLKRFSWMRSMMTEETTSSTAIRPAEAVGSSIAASTKRDAIRENETLKRKRSHEHEPETVTDEPPRKKPSLDIARRFGRLLPLPYISPYQASQTTPYVSPFRNNASLVTPPSSHNGSPHEASSTATSQAPVPSSSVSVLVKAIPSIVKYVSPYPPMEMPGFVPLGLPSTFNSNVLDRQFIENSKALKDVEIESAIKAAGELVIPDIAVQLPSSKDGVAGNLCLSKDKRSLVFLTGELPNESTAITFQVSDIIKPPKTSPLGSEPMLLQISTSRDDEVEETFDFRFLATDAAFQAANNVRAKIVTSMMLPGLESNDEVVGSIKPFRCSECDGAWKNMEGLKYHSTKSKTSCNPNYQPKAGPRAGLQRRHSVEKEESTSSADQDTSGAATSRPRESAQKLDGSSVARPEPKLSAIADDEDRASRSSFNVQSAVAKKKFSDNHSQPGPHCGKEIIITLLHANLQVFPGEKSLWFAYVATFLQKYPDSDLPNYAACNTVLDLLIDNGQVRNVQFSFKDSIGLMRIRTLITMPNVDPLSDVVRSMKEKMKAAFPDHYIPNGFAPSLEIQSMLEKREHQPMNESGSNKSTKHISWDANLTVEQGGCSSQPSHNHVQTSQVTRSGRTSRRPQRPQAVDDRLVLQAIMEPLVENPEEAMDIEEGDSYGEDLSQLDRGLSIKANGRKKKRFRAIVTKPEGANATRPAELFQTIEDMTLNETGPDDPRPKRQKAGPGPAMAAQNQSAMWQQPGKAFLQSANGAWHNQTPPRIPHKYTYKNRCPEPVTYMQTLNNAAWHFRPFGHGVRPIFARPSKRSESSKPYLTRIENGFRPVLMKMGETHTLAMPFRSEMAKEPRSRAAIKPRTRNKKRPFALLENQTESFEPVHKKPRRRPPNNIRGEGTQSELEEESGRSSTVSDFNPFIGDLNYRVTDPAVPSETRSTSFDGRPGIPLTTSNPSLQCIAERSKHTGNDSMVDNDRPYIMRWQKPRALPGPSGSCPHPDGDEDLEIGSGSATMKEWFPSAPSTSNQLQLQGFDGGLARADEASSVPKTTHQQLQNGSIPQYMMKSRRLTALPADVEHVEKYLLHYPELKTEVALGHQHDQRRRTKEGAMSPDMDYRLMVAVVVIRTLTGGLDKQIDWVLVSKLFPSFPMNYVSKRWQFLLKKHKNMIERLSPDFQEFFLEAYESGEIPAIDYDHLLDYDWDGLLDLVLKRIDLNPNRATAQELPDSRSYLNQMYDIQNAENNKAWRDDYFGLLPPVYKRMEHAASEQYSIAVSRGTLSIHDTGELTVARSWARANTLTPAGVYDRDSAARKLATLGNNTLKAATTSLFESKVLMQRNKGRPLPDRGVEITDTFAASFRKHLDEKHLTQAAIFKADLDAKLRAGEIVKLEWTANDGDILAITNLQAYGRIKLEPQGVPMNKFGLTDGGYQTKKMDKRRLLFDMQIIPTEKYIFDDDLPILDKLTENVEPPRCTNSAIPLWYDIAENIIPTWWKKTLCVVLGTLAMRPGVEVKELVRLFNPAIEEWEMRLLLEWGVRVGALKVLMEGHEEWTVEEWWWVIGGRA